MIRELKERRLFAPMRLINSIVRWVLGVHSPTGTVRVRNTACPSGGRSLALDVDMEAVFADVERRLDGRGLSAAQRARIRDVVRANIDGTSLVWTDAGAAVNEAWLTELAVSVAAETMAEGGFVTVAGEQTITGEKTFGQNVTVKAGASGANTTLGNGFLELWRSTPYIDFHYGESAEDYTSRLIELESGRLTIVSPSHALLSVHPADRSDQTDSTNALARQIATIGWINEKFWRKNTTATGLIFNTEGTLSFKSIGTTSGTVAAGDHNHDSDYAAKTHTHSASEISDLPSAPSPSSATPHRDGYDNWAGLPGSSTAYARADHVHPLNVPSDGLPEKADGDGDRGTSGYYARADHVHPVNDITDLTCSIDGHSGNCLIVAEGTSITHSGNSMYDVLAALAALCTTEDHAVTDWPFPEWAENATKANRLLGTDASGNLKGVASLLTSSPSTDKVLTVKKNGTAVTWEDASSSPAENPSSKTNLTVSGEGSDTAASTTWTAGGNNGVQVTVQTRTYYNHSAATPKLYGFQRTFTFDKYGRLYSVSAESRFEIDTPVSEVS